MRYFPVLQELFESDTIVLFIIGAALGFGIGFKLKTAKSRICAVITSILTYAVWRAYPTYTQTLWQSWSCCFWEQHRLGRYQVLS